MLYTTDLQQELQSQNLSKKVLKSDLNKSLKSQNFLREAQENTIILYPWKYEVFRTRPRKLILKSKI